MPPNPILKKLGLSNQDRVVIFHADDIGMCHASLAAYQELVQFGLLSAAATMVPCGWFPAVAAYCRENQAQNPHLDMGVHLTLTSEWDGYRWRPLSTLDPATGLLDEEGYFHRQVQPVQEGATETAVLHELTAQIEIAMAAGIEITHFDSHMGTLFHPRFLPAYFQLAFRYHTPVLAPRWGAERLQQEGFEKETAEWLSQALLQLEDQGLPLMDTIDGLWLDKPDNRLDQAKAWVDALSPGVHYFIVHPSVETAELRTITPDWQARVEDYRLFTNETWRNTVKNSGLHVIGMRALKNLM